MFYLSGFYLTVHATGFHRLRKAVPSKEHDWSHPVYSISRREFEISSKRFRPHYLSSTESKDGEGGNAGIPSVVLPRRPSKAGKVLDLARKM